MKVKLENASKNEFTEITSEEWREYTFPNKERIYLDGGFTDVVRVRIYLPQYLSVSESGGHRILDSEGHSHYIPSGWIHLEWSTFPNNPHFVI